MSGPPPIATRAGIEPFVEVGAAGALDARVSGGGPWEIEIGFGKGRFLISRAANDPGRRFLGIESAGEYFRLAAGRLRRKGLANVALLHGEALALLATAVPRGFAETLHLYFPDPWPKTRHARRRLLQPETLDVLLGALAPGGRLCFATDHLPYAAQVESVLKSCPSLSWHRLESGWPGGPRTNYELKYVGLGRPIVRFEAFLEGRPEPHPEGLDDLVVACGRIREDGPADEDQSRERSGASVRR